MVKSPLHVAVTGGGGNIGYSLLFRIASGQLFPGVPIALHILERQEVMTVLEGVKMELGDCSFPLLTQVIIGSDARKVFEGVDVAILVGAKPRGPGMERKDLLQENAKIFVEQGKALNEVASRDVRVLVVGNPCNTNCLIALHSAPNIPKSHFCAMTRLDQNRAHAFIAEKAAVPVTEVSNFVIWGNHSTTQVPDFVNAKISGKPLLEVLRDRNWLEGDFIKKVQNRGAEIIKARGSSSAASAASSAIDTIRSLYAPGDIFSLAVPTAGNPYGIDPDLVFSFPCRMKSEGEYEIIPNIPWDNFLETKIRASEKELLEERALIQNLF
jgi:malate dehydrogenase